jgi:hypothetical protein
MWKVGDKIKCILYDGDSIQPWITIGKTYEILEVIKNYHYDNEHKDKYNQQYRIMNDQGGSWWIQPHCFKLVFKTTGPEKSEVEILDRIQENFK